MEVPVPDSVDHQSVLSASGSEIFRYIPGVSVDWEPVVYLDGVRDATRIAVSPDGEWLTIVGAVP